MNRFLNLLLCTPRVVAVLVLPADLEEGLKTGVSYYLPDASNARFEKFLVDDEGSNGAVALFQRGGIHDRVVVKQVLREDDEANEIFKARSQAEKNIWKILQPVEGSQVQANIMRYDKIMEDGDSVLYQMPFAVQGSLLNQKRLHSGKKLGVSSMIFGSSTIPKKQSYQLIVDAFEGVEYMHSHNIIHRDLKIENILVQDGVAMISDFGAAAQLQEGEMILASASLQDNLIPEVLRTETCQLEVNDAKFAQSLDVWALGCMFYEMLTGAMPFFREDFTDGHHKQQFNFIRKQIKYDQSEFFIRLEEFTDFSDAEKAECIDFFKKIFAVNRYRSDLTMPDERLKTVQEVKNHSFYVNYLALASRGHRARCRRATCASTKSFMQGARPSSITSFMKWSRQATLSEPPPPPALRKSPTSSMGCSMNLLRLFEKN